MGWGSIHYNNSISDHGTITVISIWQTPEIKFPVTYSFPDDTGQVGYAVLLHELGLPEQLSGEVFFWRVDQDDPAEGKFDLVTEAGQQIHRSIQSRVGKSNGALRMK